MASEPDKASKRGMPDRSKTPVSGLSCKNQTQMEAKQASHRSALYAQENVEESATGLASTKRSTDVNGSVKAESFANFLYFLPFGPKSCLREQLWK